ncbi:SNF2 family N-terminal domain-containing protein [Boeremia exigua]|uniref:SNF2 family N-terminal domain-containing protein n=1 Tax=Boeremia exigua TaxID=749465 RepID=UPI001E8D09CD|nr:SNF2 family N-terminal domain-containing protein [Boeremia exigua]KAH6612407.1 SNF2 family N-terminal domain-containing protein [Boeremia exigua]
MPPRKRQYGDLGSQSSPSSSAHSANPRAPKQPRTTNTHPTRAAGSSQHDALVIDSDDDDDASQEAPDSTQSYNEQQSSYGLYGVIHNKIVGVRYYNGYATVGEMVICRREPHNQYDGNAIQVLNVQGEQIGHIPKTLASKLAKYMDNQSLLVEAQITGPKGMFECPIEVRVYGTNEPVERESLLAQMRQDKLPVAQAADRKRKETAAQKERQRLAKEAAKRAKKNGGAVVGVGKGVDWENSMSEYMAGSSQADGMGPGPSLEDIIGGSERFNPRNFENIVEEFGVKEQDLAAMPKAAQPAALQTEMHPFQLQGLQWMLDKESPQLPAQGTKDVVQLWQRHPQMPNAFTNLATNYSITNPKLASGGILADDMGLGKTIQVISLIMADRALNRRASGVTDASLILAPVSVMSNWSTQMKRHIKPEHALRVMFWHGARKEPITPKQIENYDVVISTYESISSDWYSQKSTALPRKSGPFSVTWRRVILDEGHNIRNPKAKKTIAVSSLLTQSRWSLTGTPIINNLKDLYSQVRFLRLSGGLDSFEIFHGAISRPVLAGDPQGNKALQLLMGGICLRRKKEMSFIDLRLPELSEYVHKFQLHPHEQEKYDALEAQAKGTLDIYKNNIGNRKASDTYRHLLEVLLRMRQLCNHWQLVGEERLDSIMKQLEAEGVVDLTAENKEALQKMLQLSIDSQEDCPICFDTYKDPVITKCAHIFCTPCLERVIELQGKCPMCRAELESFGSTTVKPAVETSAKPEPTAESEADKASLEKQTSSKVEQLLQILAASAKDKTNKTIIFSQWTSFLDLIQGHLSAAGFKFTRIDGSMSAVARDAALEALDSDPETTIMLASLAVCSVGLNLVAANQVIMADSWWAPAIEDQAVDRVHRLGQKRETTVFRLVVEDSVEERVLGIQSDKRKLMAMAFAERGGGKKKNVRSGGLGDLSRLLGQASTSADSGTTAETADASRRNTGTAGRGRKK